MSELLWMSVYCADTGCPSVVGRSLHLVRHVRAHRSDGVLVALAGDARERRQRLQPHGAVEVLEPRAQRRHHAHVAALRERRQRLHGRPPHVRVLVLVDRLHRSGHMGVPDLSELRQRDCRGSPHILLLVLQARAERGHGAGVALLGELGQQLRRPPPHLGVGVLQPSGDVPDEAFGAPPPLRGPRERLGRGLAHALVRVLGEPQQGEDGVLVALVLRQRAQHRAGLPPHDDVQALDVRAHLRACTEDTHLRQAC
mmetsp:Transcript_20808/g.65678  ORF Transcript_20808/g.65678 Transcript_20808/m.65678 type:complete len:255 (+) Transcript_20808:26-790(+)